MALSKLVDNQHSYLTPYKICQQSLPITNNIIPINIIPG